MELMDWKIDGVKWKKILFELAMPGNMGLGL